jgi:hypothetical protein
MSFDSQIAASARQLTNRSDKTALADVTVEVSGELVDPLFAHQYAGGKVPPRVAGHPVTQGTFTKIHSVSLSHACLH